MCLLANNTSPMAHYEANTDQQIKRNKRKRHLSRHRQNKRVTFCQDVTVGEAADCTNHDSDRSNSNVNSWYSLSELEDFKNRTKEQARKYRSLSTKAVSSSATMSSLVLPFRNCGVYKKMKYLVKVQSILNEKNKSSVQNQDNTKHEFRGLENRIFVEKQRNRTIAMNTVMEYQRRTQALIEDAAKNNTPEEHMTVMKRQFAERLATICRQLSQWSKDEALAAAHFDAEGTYSLPSDGTDDFMAKVVEQVHRATSPESVDSQSSKRSRSMISRSDSDEPSLWMVEEQGRAKRTRIPV